jgi:outer membrane protein TolC
VGGFFGGGLTLGVPLWRWFSDGPDRLARAETAVRQAEFATVERSLIASLRSHYANYETARQAVEEYSAKLIPQALEAYRIAVRLFEEGEATYLEVLTAQSGFIDTQSAHIEAIRQVEIYRAELEYIVGEELR